MRGELDPQADMYCLVSPEKFVPQDHPLRAIKPFVDQALRELSPLFELRNILELSEACPRTIFEQR
jgi:hypothetical protein